jgi:hypothetical protein
VRFSLCVIVLEVMRQFVLSTRIGRQCIRFLSYWNFGKHLEIFSLKAVFFRWFCHFLPNCTCDKLQKQGSTPVHLHWRWIEDKTYYCPNKCASFKIYPSCQGFSNFATPRNLTMITESPPTCPLLNKTNDVGFRAEQGINVPFLSIIFILYIYIK